MRRWAPVLMLAQALTAALAPGPALAQDAAAPLGQVQSAVLVVDVDRLFSESLFGERLVADLRAETEALAQENRRIEAALTEEEQDLTDRRPGMTVEAFRAEAQAFDTRVQGIRAAQDAKERAIQSSVNAGRERFLEAAAPVLDGIMRSSGATVILDRRSVFLARGAIDVTDAALAAIDAAIGDGAALEEGGPAEAPAP